MREPEDGESQHATHQGLPAYVAEIPAHVHVLHLHQGKAADGADAEHVATRHHTVGDDLPVYSIGLIYRVEGRLRVAQSHHVVQREEVHRRSEVVEHGAQHSSHNAMQPHARMLIAYAQPCCEIVEGTRFRHHAHSQHHAHHEEHHLDNAILQNQWGTTLHHRIHVHELAIEDFVHDPEDAEHAQRTQERTEFGDVMEGRDKPQASDAHQEHQQSLPHVEARVISAERHGNPLRLHPIRQHALHHRRRDEPRSQARKQERKRENGGSNGSGIPEHQAFRVTDNGKRTAAVGGKEDGTAEYHTLSATWDDAVHDGEHQHGGGKIIEVDRDDEGDDGEYPKHLPAAARAKQLAHEVEAAVVIEYIHDGHGGEQKKHDFGSPAHLW